MRARLIFLLLAILLVAGFAALNWPQIVTPTSLNFGILNMSAPLGLILLSVLAITLVAFLISSIHMQTVSLLDNRQHYKELQAQRDLADKAEASRFTELRQHLDAQMREIHQRETIAATELEKAVAQGQRELRTQLELMNRTLASRLGEIEGRMEARADTRVVETRDRPTTATIVS